MVIAPWALFSLGLFDKMIAVGILNHWPVYSSIGIEGGFNITDLSLKAGDCPDNFTQPFVKANVIRLRAEFITRDPTRTPVLESYRLKLGD